MIAPFLISDIVEMFIDTLVLKNKKSNLNQIALFI